MTTTKKRDSSQKKENSPNKGKKQNKNQHKHKHQHKNQDQKRHRRNKRNSQSNKKKEVKWTDKLSEHFSKKDFVCKESEGLKISLGLVGALELLHTKIEKRIHIIKGFESLEVAEKRRDFKRNYHTQGLAADISVDDISPKELFLIAEEIDEFKGIGLNLDEPHLHVDTRKADERVIWVETKGDKIDITADNRSKYL